MELTRRTALTHPSRPQPFRARRGSGIRTAALRAHAETADDGGSSALQAGNAHGPVALARSTGAISSLWRDRRPALSLAIR
jgi:hypothetical protein